MKYPIGMRMRSKPTAKSRRESVQRHREKMRARGFRLIQIWVPDTASPGFAEECRRQSLLVAHDPAEKIVMDELEALQDTMGWTE